MATDSNFPFKPGDQVNLEVKGNELIIKKAVKNES